MTLMLMAALPLAAQQAYWDGTASQDWTGTGSEADPYIITTPQQLAGLAEAVNGGRDFRGEYIKLGADLYMCDPDAEQDARPQWTPIGGILVEHVTEGGGGYAHDTLRFCGTFDGGGHTVYNVYHSTLPDLSDWDDPLGSGVIDVSGWYRGFFGWIEEATVKNLHLENVNIVGAATVGGLVMVSKNSTITGCSVSGVVGCPDAQSGLSSGGLVANNQGGTIENCTSSANVKGIRGVGCLVGYNSGTIRDCHATGDAHCVQYHVGGLVGSNLEGGLIERCSSAGKVSRDYYQYAIQDCGGFVGQNMGTIRECSSSANVISSQHGAGFCGVNGGRIESCYATGDVTIGGNTAATFVGANGRGSSQALDPAPYEGIIINCFATGKCVTTTNGWLEGFLATFQDGNNRETITAYCVTDADNYPYNGLIVTEGGTRPGCKGGALRRTTAVMQSQAFVDTLNKMAAVAGTSLWEWREGNYPLPTGVKADITSCFSGGGSGTKDDPFRIRTKQDLEWVSALTNLGWRFDNQYILLENDIELNAPFEEWGTTPPTLWHPIGRSVSEKTPASSANFEYEFRGTFDGGFHSVRNMYLNDVTGETPQGFFGIINGAVIKNLSVEGAWIKAVGSTGILVGKSTRYCMPTNILQCHTSGTAEGSWAAGGIMGAISLDGITNIINCSSAAVLVPGEYGAHMVVGDQNYIGGTAYSNDTVANYLFTGRMEDDPGSFFGKEISINCYYDMEKWVRPDKWTGIETYGRTTEYLQSKEFANVFNYYVAQYNERHADSPLHYWQVNIDDYPSLTETKPPHTVTYVTDGEYYTPQPVLDDSRIVPPPVPELEGQIFYGWFSDENRTKPYVFDTTQITSSFPLYAKWQAELEPDFTPFTNPFATTYVISTPEQLLGFSRAVQGVEGVIDRMDFVGKTVKLGADIMLNDTSGWQYWGDYTYGRQWEPISPDEVYCTFGGTFDGDGHTISGMYICDDSYSDATGVRIGLFSRLRPDAVVKNLNIKASRIIYTSRYGTVGLLVGFNRGTVDSCTVEGKIDVTRCTAGLIAGVSQYNYDGVVGSDIIRDGIGRISNSRVRGSIVATNATYETPMGGLVGLIHTNDSIVNCSARASVISTGSEENIKYVGGLIGKIDRGTVIGCHAMPDSLVANAEVGGIAGYMSVDGTGFSAIIDCHTEGDITLGINYLGGIVGHADEGQITGCTFNGSIISTGDFIGGIAGRAVDTVRECSVEGIIEGNNSVGGITGNIGNRPVMNSRFTGSVTGNINVGGIIGYGSATNSHTTGTVTGVTRAGGIAGYGSSIVGCTSAAEIIGDYQTGGIAGSSSAIRNCSVTGNVTGGSVTGGLTGSGNTVDSCVVTGDVIAMGDTVGGLIGWHTYNTVSNSRAEGKVSGRNNVGGFAGHMDGAQITRCVATGDVTGEDYVGAFVGTTSSASSSTSGMNLSYATGDVKGRNYVGGFSGNGGGMYCFARGNVSGEDYVGGFGGEVQQRAQYCFSTGKVAATGEHKSGFGVMRYPNYVKYSYYDSETSGMSDSELGTPLSTIGMKAKKSYEEWDFETTWGRKDTINDGYPYLRWMYDEFIADDEDPKIPASGITISKEDTTLEAGMTLQLSATITPDNAEETVQWSTSAAAVASVDVNGLVSAIAPGEAVITATTSESGLTAECRVTVVEPIIRVTKVTIDETLVPSRIKVGESVQLAATVEPENAVDKTVTWSIGDNEYVSLTPDGVLAGIKETGRSQSVIITATAGGISDVCSPRIRVEAAAGAVTGVRLDCTGITVSVGGTWQLNATVEPDDAQNKSVTWESSDESVATVDENGLVTGKSAGSATVTVRTVEGGYTAQCMVNVEGDETVAVTGVRLDNTRITVGVGGTWQLNATVEPEDAENKSVTWESSDESVATVDENGLVTGKSAGSATVTVRTEEGGYTAQCMVNVEGDETVAVTGVRLDNTGITVGVGGTWQLNATVEPEDAENKSVTWESSDESVATVDENGLVTGKSAGSATVTVRTVDGGYTAQCSVTVEGEETVLPTGVTLSHTTLNMQVGEEAQLIATVQPADATDKSITWESNAPETVSVDSEGRLTAHKAGTAVITARTVNGFSAFCMVTVEEDDEPEIPVTGISLSPTYIELTEGETAQLTVTIEPEDATDRSISWESSDEDIATVGADGTVRAIAAGTSLITVTTTDGGYTAECRIKVVGGTDVEMTAADAVTVYPNPVRDVLNVETGGAAVVRMEMTDATGHAVMSIEGDVHTVDVSALPEGLYLLRIETGSGVTVRRIVKRM